MTPIEAPKTDHTVEFADDDPWRIIDSCQTIRRKLNACSTVNVAADAEDDEAETAPKPLENDRLRLIAASNSDTCNRNRWAAMLPDVFPALISTILRAEETVTRRLAILRAERPELYTRSAVNVAAGDEAETAPKPLENDRVRLVAASNSDRAATLPDDIQFSAVISAIVYRDEIAISLPFLVQPAFWANHASKLHIGDTIEVYYDHPNFRGALCFLAVKGIEKGVPEIVESLPYHPIVDVLPIMRGAEFDELVDDIKATGKLREKIVLHEGMILVGRDRYRACVAAGLFKPSSDPKVHIKDTKHFVVLPANQDPIDFVGRGRRLTESQHAFFAELATMRPASAPKPAVIAPTANDRAIAPPPRGNGWRQARKPIDERIEDHNSAFAPYYPGDPQGDPWQTVRRKLNVVSLDARGDDVRVAAEVEDEPEPDQSGLIPKVEDDEAEKPERDLREVIAKMKRIRSNVLDKQEQFVIAKRYDEDVPVPYETIAKICRPQISGRSQARKIEQRALKKIHERVSNSYAAMIAAQKPPPPGDAVPAGEHDLTPKPDKSPP